MSLIFAGTKRHIFKCFIIQETVYIKEAKNFKNICVEEKHKSVEKNKIQCIQDFLRTQNH